MLTNGRVDALIIKYVDGEAKISQLRFRGSVARWPHWWANVPAYLVLNKRDAALVPRINAAARSHRPIALILPSA